MDTHSVTHTRAVVYIICRFYAIVSSKRGFSDSQLAFFLWAVMQIAAHASPFSHQHPTSLQLLYVVPFGNI